MEPSGDQAPQTSPDEGHVVFPLVESEQPGIIHLTNERIAEIFEQEDIEYARRFFPDPPQD